MPEERLEIRIPRVNRPALTFQQRDVAVAAIDAEPFVKDVKIAVPGTLTTAYLTLRLPGRRGIGELRQPRVESRPWHSGLAVRGRRTGNRSSPSSL